MQTTDYARTVILVTLSYKTEAGLTGEDCCGGNAEPTLGEEPVSVLDDGLHDGHHVYGRSCSHFGQTPVRTHAEEQRLQALDHERLRRAKITECFADIHTILAEDNGSQRSVLSSCVYK